MFTCRAGLQPLLIRLSRWELRGDTEGTAPACRFKHLHKKHVVHPLNNRKIPIITDKDLVDMNFGTGAVKITPAHDPNDFAARKRNDLDSINIFTDEGNINEAGGQFAGLPRFKVGFPPCLASCPADVSTSLAPALMARGTEMS